MHIDLVFLYSYLYYYNLVLFLYKKNEKGKNFIILYIHQFLIFIF